MIVHARERELGADLARRVEVVEVVEAELLAVQLRDLREQVLAQADLGVVGGALVRVLAVLELEDLLVVAHDVVREVALGLAEPVGDDEVVVRRAVERLGGELTQGLVPELARLLELVEDLVVVLVAGHHGDARVVLGGRADHARSADVDVLDHDLVLDPAPPGDLLERVEAADDHVDGLDAVVGDGLHVLRHVAPRQHAGHEPRVHGLDAPVEHLREPGDLFDEGDRDAGVLEQPRRAAGGDDGDPHVGEALGERLDATLVEDGDKCSLDLHSRCSFGRIYPRGTTSGAALATCAQAYKKGCKRGMGYGKTLAREWKRIQRDEARARG